MTAREWLERARTVTMELEALQDTRDEMEDRLMKTTSTITGDIVDGTKDPHKFDQLGDIAFQITEAIKTCQQIYAETMAVIRQVDNGKYRTLLELRYIKNETWERIAVKMNYSWRQTHRIHGWALVAVGEVLKRNGKDYR